MVLLLGYSYGGAAAMRVANWLKDRGVAVDLVVTCDPVENWKIPNAVVPMTDPRPANVTRWDNFYQNFDTGSILGGVMKVFGQRINGANTNTQITQANSNLPPMSAHIDMPTLQPVCTTITNDIKAIANSRPSYKYQGP
jgi:hypothetical protein